ncbi:MAG: SDR family NAD(P)-dependent oxidoreductase [Clostridia bacterium]|nr:SDR family NAD(P)-dependent oxidoreductase [Clostridia bacterium]
MQPNPIAVVTGGSSGIGRATVTALQEKGCCVFALSRRAQGTPEGATHIQCDITSDASVQAAVASVLEAAGRIDILVNCAGAGIAGAVEFTDTAAAKFQFDILFHGTDRMCRAVLPHMRKNGGGHIVNVSSVAAVAPIPFQTYYAAAKAAVDSYTMALANEVRPFGIRVCAVLPGDIKTGFTAARVSECKGDDVYNGRIRKGIATMEKDEENGMDPAVVGRAIAKAALQNNPRPLQTVGFSYKAAVLLVKLLPARAANFILRKLYA